MQKPKMFNRVICFVIAMLMLMPGLPGNVALAAVPTANDIKLQKEATKVTDNTYKVKLSVKGADIDTSKKVDVVLVIDSSGSMYNTNSGGKTLATITRDAANSFVEGVLTSNNNTSGNVRVSVVRYGENANAYRYNASSWSSNWSSSLTLTGSEIYTTSLTSAKAAITAATNSNQGGTNTEGGFLMAQKASGVKRSDAESIVIFMTDGMPTFRYNGNSADSGGGTYGGQNTSKEELNEAIAAAQLLKTGNGAKIYTVALLSAVTSASNQAKLASNLLSLTPKTYTSNSNTGSIMSYVDNSGRWASATAYAERYYSIFSGDNASDKMQEIYSTIAGNINALAIGTVVDIIPSYFKLTPASRAELIAAEVEITDNIDGSTTLTFKNVPAKGVAYNLPEYVVESQSGVYGAGETNISATYNYTLNTPGGGTGSEDFPKPVVPLKPVAFGDAYTVHKGQTLTVAASDSILNNDVGINPTKLQHGGYTVSGLQVASSSVTTIMTTAGGTVVLNVDGTFTYNPPANFTGADTFTYKNSVTVSGGSLAGEYSSEFATVTITVLEPTAITVKANSKSKIYDGTQLTDNGWSLTSGVLAAGDSLVVTVNGTIINAGTAPNSISEVKVMNGSTDVTYKYAIETIPGILEVIPKAVTIDVDDKSKAYGEAEPVFTGTVTGLVNASDLGEVTYKRTNTDENVGNYEEVLDAEYTANTNYTVTVNKGDFEITASEVMTVNAENVVKEYDGNSYGVTAASNISGATIKYWNESTQAYDLDASPEIANVANSVLTVKFQATHPNYTAVTGQATVTITPKAVTIDVDDKSKAYGEAEPVFTGTVTGLVNASDLGEVTYKRTNTDENVGNYEEVLDAKYTDNPNYTVTVKKGDFRILGPNSVVYVVNYLEQGTNRPLADSVTKSGIFGEEVTERSIDIKGYNKVGSVEKTITLDVYGNVINFYYSEQKVIDDSDFYEINWMYETGYNTDTYNKRYETDGEGSVTESDIANYVQLHYDSGYTYVRRVVNQNTVEVIEVIDVTSGAAITGSAVTGTGIKLVTTTVVDLYYDRNYTGGGDDDDDDDSTIITDTLVPLAELEKLDHFAYVIGYPEGDVRPLNNITREEVAMIFYRLLTDESRNQLLSDTNPFTDMEGHGWSNRAISTLYSAGIIKGYPDGTFRPSAPISRAEFATIAAKFDKLELNNASKFTDIFGHWAEKYITSSENKGWIKGYPDMTFKPEQDITRAEAMTLINNVLGRTVPEENIHPDAMFWPDNPSSEWYHEAVMEATNSHDYIYEEDGDELWTGLKANKVWP